MLLGKPLHKTRTRPHGMIKWHNVKLVRDSKKGTIEIYFDDMKKIHMSAVDKTFGKGRIGLGSFDDMNDFDDIKIWGK